MLLQMHHQILLYYKYTLITDPTALLVQQKELCTKLNLTGRIILAREGINGTVEGTVAATEQYIADLSHDPRFADITWKRSTGTGTAFPKLSIKIRDEIVSAHLATEDINPTQLTGNYLSPTELHTWFEQGEEFYIIDMRNEYEHRVGHFAGSILPALENFRDLPRILPSIAHLKDKKVLTVCTGGVRCEKASGFLLQHGFSDVYQLQGGIVSYMEHYPNTYFHGKLYVFDNRIVMGFGDDTAQQYVTVGTCERCGMPCERYVNCANLSCHRHFICCTQCAAQSESALCVTCARSVTPAHE